MKESSETSNSPLSEAYKLVGATTPLELQRLYSEEDQRLWKKGEWDYNNPDLITNKIKEILEDINPMELSAEELEWREEMLWFWYHHATSVALNSNHKDNQAAQEYVAMALAYKSEGNPNKITQLLYFLVNDQIKEAEEWAKTITEEPEKSSARDLIKEYKEKGFFE
jgi:hypothetical protein